MRKIHTNVNLFDLVFGLFILVCILDPSDQIFGAKLYLFTFCIFLGVFKGNLSNENLGLSIIVSIVLPIFYLLYGILINEHHSFQIALNQLKTLLLFTLLPFLKNHKSYFQSYSILTFILVPLTGIIFYLVTNAEITILEFYIGDYENTLKTAVRTYGGVDLIMIYHNSVAILLFGFSLSLFYASENRYYYFLSFLGLATLFLSTTRANWISVILILLFHLYQVSKKLNNYVRSIIFLLLGGFFSIMIIPFFVNILFNPTEKALSEKSTFLNDYSQFWTNHPELLLLGEGLGNGFRTNLRGITYNVEFTYLEIIRIYGIVGFIFFMGIIFYPLVKYKNLRKRLGVFKSKYDYLYFTYFIYCLIVIPSNPLLFSSTGFLLLIIIYSDIFYLSKLSTCQAI